VLNVPTFKHSLQKFNDTVGYYIENMVTIHSLCHTPLIELSNLPPRISGLKPVDFPVWRALQHKLYR